MVVSRKWSYQRIDAVVPIGRRSNKTAHVRPSENGGPSERPNSLFGDVWGRELDTPVVINAGVKIDFTNLADLNEVFRDVITSIVDKIEKFELRGSGHTFNRVLEFQLNYAMYRPLSGSSYIPTPKKIEAKKAVKNPINENDDECIKWCLLDIVSSHT